MCSAMVFKPVQKLTVIRTLSTGERVVVGVLAQNRRGVFFQYDRHYLDRFDNLSPFTLQASTQVQPAPTQPHQGLHGVFGDSLPDAWGLRLQDRVFRQQGILPAQLTAMDRLAFVGDHGMGALSFSPRSEFASDGCGDLDLGILGVEAQAVFNDSLARPNYPVEFADHTLPAFAALVAGGSSGGARPKVQVCRRQGETASCRIVPNAGDDAWLVKFTSHHLPLGHEESLCEAVYLQMAGTARCGPADWQLIDAPKHSGAIAWLALKRFDYISDQSVPEFDRGAGRLHMHSACGLLDADFRSPSLDYMDLMKASRQLCQSPAVGQLQFRRAVFNLLASNQDDHSKNWAFLQADNGQWQPAPFYDVTFSPHPFNEHATAFGGYGKAPPLKVMQRLSASAGFSDWYRARQDIEAIADALGQWTEFAQQVGVRKTTIAAISSALSQRRRENSALF